MPTREEVVEHYLQRTGLTLPEAGWQLLRGVRAVPAGGDRAQIWYRYRAGQTNNPAFAGFGAAVNQLVARAEVMVARPGRVRGEARVGS